MKSETLKDLNEMLKMLLIILLWIAAYSIGTEVVKAYARKSDCKIELQDLTEPMYANNAKGNGK